MNKFYSHSSLRFKYLNDDLFTMQHLWCSGNISAFQALALDSISGRCIYLLPTASVKVMRFFPCCVYILIADFIFVAATCGASIFCQRLWGSLHYALLRFYTMWLIRCFFCNEHTVVVVLVKSNLLVIQEGSEQFSSFHCIT